MLEMRRRLVLAAALSYLPLWIFGLGLASGYLRGDDTSPTNAEIVGLWMLLAAFVIWVVAVVHAIRFRARWGWLWVTFVAVSCLIGPAVHLWRTTTKSSWRLAKPMFMRRRSPWTRIREPK